MNLEDELLFGFEIHSPQKIASCLAAGLDVNKPIGGKTPIDILIEMYLRSDRFSACVKLLVDAGARYEHQALLSIFLGDAGRLAGLLDADPALLEERHALPCAFTPLDGATLLHVCAEYRHVECAEALVARGLDVDVRAALDANGLGGQTPLFHTVNSHDNFALPMLEWLLDRGASPDVHLKGLLWGKSFEWETYIPEVNPISYAMMGNLPQFQRTQRDTAKNVEILQRRKYGSLLKIGNVPNAYLAKG